MIKNWFNQSVSAHRVKHSVHNLDNKCKSSLRIGTLAPMYLEECLPSDKFLHLQHETFLRLAPMVFPLMHNIDVNIHSFFVPWRIILGEELYHDFFKSNGSTSDIKFSPLRVQVAVDELGEKSPHEFFVGTVFDYLGYGIESAFYDDSEEPSYAMFDVKNPIPFLSYWCIVRDWFCDSQLNVTLMENITDMIKSYRTAMTDGDMFIIGGEGSLVDWECLKPFNVAWNKDYFTTARPAPQLGTEMLVMNNTPLRVVGEDITSRQVLTLATNEHVKRESLSQNEDGTLKWGNAKDVALSDGTTIRDLWRKEMLQKFFENSNLAGDRIREFLLAHFGVKISDNRLQIPAIVAMDKQSVRVQEVIQTSQTTNGEDGSALGTFAGKGSSYGITRSKKFFCEENGYLLTLVSLVPENGYSTGQQRTFFKNSLFDFAFPEFNNIGWQEVFQGELFLKPADTGEGTFGYQPRYSEYRVHPSRTTCEFRGVNSNFDAWTLNRKFDDVPNLNADFIKIDSSSANRIFNFVGDEDEFYPVYIDFFTHSTMSRPISYMPDSIHIY